MIKIKGSITDKRTAYDQLRADMANLDKAYVKVGWPYRTRVGQPSKIGSGHRTLRDQSQVAMIAASNEFGVKEAGGKWKTPPRPAFRNALDGSRVKLGRVTRKIYDDVLLGRLTPKEGLERIGIWMEGRVKRSITNLHTPANAQRTIEAKGSSNPLIDTGQMRNSVTFKTDMRGGFKQSAFRNGGKSRVGKLKVIKA